MKPLALVLSLVLVPIAACHNENSKSTTSALDENHCHAGLALTAVNPNTHDYVFPEGIAHYSAGTRVLQPRTGRRYVCKAFPYTPYCRLWSADSTLFEPGTGSNWMAAWDLQ